MKQFKNYRFILLIVSTLVIASAVSAQAPSKVLVLPFKIHSEKDLSFLNRGVMSMIASRLAASGKTDMFLNPKANQAILNAPDGSEIPMALEIAAALEADYVITGSLTVFGTSVSTDAQFIGVAEKRPLITFSQFGRNTGDVLSHIDQFAAQVNAEVFGLAPAAQAPAFRPAAPAVAGPAPAVAPRPAALAPAQTPPAPSQEPWKSRYFQTTIKSMAVGDIDGDGRDDIVFIDDQNVYAQRYTESDLVSMASVADKSYNTLVSLDVADINGNGRAEVFVTRINKARKLESFALEWSGSGLQKIADNLDYFLRVIQDTDGKHILIGQKQGVAASREMYEFSEYSGIFLPGIYELKWQGRQLVTGKNLNVPRGLNLYSFTYGNVSRKNKEAVVSFDENDRLIFFDVVGNKIWASSNKFGGNANYLEYLSSSRTREPEHFYLSQRILVTDLDQDGKTEVIVPSNHEVGGGFFSRFRHFTNGHVQCLSWNNVALREKWKTDDHTGYISDIALSDLNRDGRTDLVFSVVADSGDVFNKAQSYLMVRWNVQ